jgi:hypothetical protein
MNEPMYFFKFNGPTDERFQEQMRRQMDQLKRQMEQMQAQGFDHRV